ncbi:nucleoside hydrolase [Pikeienuella sp. HZG-20]|uniref:nucleoside hydrolase n=1 Tax=Paludibacillus litoralis TaxID=3133267 RepID=UPI0030EB4FB3
MRLPVIIDTDPGQDDAVAILLALASPELDVRAIVTVAGNVDLARTTANALRVVELAGRERVPVHAGADRPLLFPLETASAVCGPDGLAGAGLPPPAGAPASGRGVEALIAALRDSPEKLTICALGPLTNIALALRLAPDVAGRIERIALMGGARDLGNVTPAAEFNFHVDPHAAAIVFGAGVPIVMFGLQVTQAAVPTGAELERLAALGTASGRAVHGMMARPRAGRPGPGAYPMHDPCTVAWLLAPELFSGRDCFVEIETGPGPLRGRSTIDWNGALKRDANAHVVGSLDARGVFALLTDRIARLR